MRLPPIPSTKQDPIAAAYLRSLVIALQQREVEYARDSVLLASPGGKVYTVRVDDDGLLETEYVSG